MISSSLVSRKGFIVGVMHVIIGGRSDNVVSVFRTTSHAYSGAEDAPTSSVSSRLAGSRPRSGATSSVRAAAVIRSIRNDLGSCLNRHYPHRYQ